MKDIKSKFKGMDFSKAAENIGRRYKGRGLNRIEQNSFEEEIRQLSELQEMTRQMMGIDDAVEEYGNGGMIKRKDGSYSQRGLWDNIRANRGSGKKPTKEMLRQERKIKAEEKKYGGKIYAVGTTDPLVADPLMANTLPGDPTLPTSDNVMATPGILPVRAPSSVTSMTAVPPSVGMVSNQGTPQRGPGFMRQMGRYFRDNAFAPLVAGKGIEMIGKLGMLSGGAQMVDPVYNPYDSEVRNLMNSRGVSLEPVRQDIAAGQNAAISQTSGVRNPQVRQALFQSIYGRGMQELGRVGMQQQEVTNQYKADNAQVLAGQGAQRVAADNYAENLNNASRVGFQTSIQNIFESVGNAGQAMTNNRVSMVNQQMLADMLRTKDFGVGNVREMITAAVNGGRISPDQAIQIIERSGNKGDAAVQAEIEAMARMRDAFKKPGQ